MNTKALVLLSIGFQSVAFATTPSFSGFYAGVDLGAAQSLQKINKKIVADTIPQGGIQTIFLENSKTTNVSALAGLSLGYHQRFNQNFIIGIEARAHFNNLKTTEEDLQQEVTSFFSQKTLLRTKLRNDFALLAKLGVALDDKTSVYGLIGANWGNIKKTAEADYSHNIGVTLQSAVQAERSSYETGFMVALGSEYLIAPRTSIAFEYSYTNYGSLKFDSPISAPISINGVVAPTTAFTLDSSTKLAINKVLLRFNYHFG